jgi:hypothetical protein
MRESLAGAALAVVTGRLVKRLMGELLPMPRRASTHSWPLPITAWPLPITGFDPAAAGRGEGAP